ncbi:hypothetical protein SS50377_23646 [Spironucleus salmonicida]|uniref:Uncharacterized protein n=1 Tax=Spironucleus salmonicida TaxID=348837 RepID=V6LVK5_9EUKA|nr:hypothetical protein SS50377_23646 [Spironucleus salmonicida]|eukprot:EST48630.1 hypothetical protein SS50377_11242 [Spironucleus salmonicida]
MSLKPLPEEITDKTCSFCGVSYLIMHEIEELKNQIDDLTRRLAQETRKNSSSRQQENNSNKSIQSLAELNTQLNKSLEQSQEQLAKYRKDLELQKDLIDEFEKENIILKRGVQHLKVELSDFKKQLKIQIQGYQTDNSIQIICSVEKIIEIKNSEIIETKYEVNKLEQQNIILQTEIKSITEILESTQQNSQKVLQENSDLRLILQNRDMEIQKLNNLIDKLNLDKTEQDQIIANLNQQIQILENQNKKILASQTTDQDLTNQLQIRLNQLQADYDQSCKLLSSVTNQLRDSNLQYIELQTESKQMLENTISAKDEFILNLNNQLKQLKQQLLDTNSSSTYQTQQLEDLLQKIQSYKEHESLSSTQILELKSKLHSANMTIEQQKDQIQSKTDTIETLTHQTTDLTAKNNQIKTEISDLQLQLQDISIKQNQASKNYLSQIDQLQTDIKQKLELVQQKSNEIFDLENQLKNLGKMIENMENLIENNKNQQNNDQLEQENTNLKAKLKALQQTVLHECKERNELMRTLSQYRTQLSELGVMKTPNQLPQIRQNSNRKVE